MFDPYNYDSNLQGQALHIHFVLSPFVDATLVGVLVAISTGKDYARVLTYTQLETWTDVFRVSSWHTLSTQLWHMSNIAYRAEECISITMYMYVSTHVRTYDRKFSICLSRYMLFSERHLMTVTVTASLWLETFWECVCASEKWYSEREIQFQCVYKRESERKCERGARRENIIRWGPVHFLFHKSAPLEYAISNTHTHRERYRGTED